jgi:hypothetical protein
MDLAKINEVLWNDDIAPENMQLLNKYLGRVKKD